MNLNKRSCTNAILINNYGAEKPEIDNSQQAEVSNAPTELVADR